MNQSLEALLAQHAEPLVRKCLLEALKGDKAAMRLCIERLLPPARERVVRIPVTVIRTPEELAQASDKVWKRMGSGQCTPGEADTMMDILERRRRIIETVELDRRLDRLEDVRDAA